MEQTKRKGSILDVIIILIVIALAAGVYVKFFRQEKTVVNANTVPVAYTIRFKSLEPVLADNLQVDDKMFDASSGNYIGTITDIELVEAKETMKTMDGEIYRASLENRVDALVTVQTNASQNGNSYYAEKSFELLRNSAKNYATKYFQYEGKIISIEAEGADAQ